MLTLNLGRIILMLVFNFKLNHKLTKNQQFIGATDFVQFLSIFGTFDCRKNVETSGAGGIDDLSLRLGCSGLKFGQKSIFRTDFSSPGRKILFRVFFQVEKKGGLDLALT
jgi:hypothetical protein